MNEPPPDELVMVSGLPELIRPLAKVLAQGIRHFSRVLDAGATDSSEDRRVHALIEQLQSPLELIDELARVAADDGPDTIDCLTALLAQEATRRSFERLGIALAATHRLVARALGGRAGQAPSTAQIADMQEAAAIVGGMARALATGVPPVIVIVTTVGDAGWLGSKLRDGGAP